MDVHFILILILSIIRVFFHLLLCIAYFFCLSVDFWQAEIFPGVLYCTYTQYTVYYTNDRQKKPYGRSYSFLHVGTSQPNSIITFFMFQLWCKALLKLYAEVGSSWEQGCQMKNKNLVFHETDVVKTMYIITVNTILCH